MEDTSTKSINNYATILGNWAEERIIDIETYANSPMVKTMNWERMKGYLGDRATEKTNTYKFLFVADIEGNYHSTIKENAGNIKDRSYFSRVMNGEEIISSPVISKSTGDEIIVVAVPIKSNSGQVLGLMGAAMELDSVNQYAQNFAKDYNDSIMYVISSDGKIIAHPEEDLIFRASIQDIEESSKIEDVLVKDIGILKHRSLINGYLLYYNKIENTDNWRLILKVSSKSIYKPIILASSALVVFGIIGIIFGYFINLKIAKSISKPIIQLQKVFNQAAEGNLNIRAKIKHNDEIGKAGASFNKMMDTISHMTYFDPLTQLPNRYTFNDKLALEINNRRFDNRRLAVAVISIDKFKRVNDLYGHEIGDDLLREIARHICYFLEEKDAATRAGGDEFILLFSGYPDGNVIIKKIMDILDMIKDVWNIEGNEIHITASGGIVFYKEDGHTPEELIQNAMISKSSAKELGGDNCQFYNPSHDDDLKNQLIMENSLFGALERKELYLNYQPIIDIEMKRIMGIEALIRWNSPKLGIVPPSVFIPIAEENGLVVELGRWVLKEACLLNKSLQQQNLRPIIVSVNISIRQFEKDDFVDIVKEVLKETALEGKYLELEITESIAMENIEKNIIKLKELNLLGVKVSLDDFGTGYSTLSYFTKIPIDNLKIDQSFVQSIPDNENSKAIVSTIISMGNILKINSTAEGIETREQLEFIKNQKCDKAQGYFFSKPIEAKALLKLLQEDKLYT